jgi:DNA polymerase
MSKLTIDFETRSAAPLKKCGAAAYAADDSTEVICLAMKWEGQEPKLWFAPPFREATGYFKANELLTDEQVWQWMEDADIIEAHNAQFEFFVWRYVMPRYGFHMFGFHKLRCSAAKAAMFGLPRDLAGACMALGVRQQKDIEGSKLMLRLCKPRAPHKDEKLRDPNWQTRLYWHGTPEEFAREGRYCMQDVRAEESLSNALPELPDYEQGVWQFDLDVNARGIRIDVPSVKKIMSCIDEHSAKLKKEFTKMTGLQSPTQRDATLKHLLALGVRMDGLTAKDVEKALAATENETVKAILEIRQSLSKSSTAKYQAFLNSVCPDNRVRGAFMYHGAGTGRWTGRLIQPQNFPRGAFSDVESCLALFNKEAVDAVSLLYGDPMVAASTCLRGMMIPGKDREFICADYSSVEGRVLAWLANEETALDVYRSGRDPYKVNASAIYGVPYDEVTKQQRQVGKVAELALGYQGSVGAFNAMAVNYGVVLPDGEVKQIVQAWREAHPKTTAMWRDLEKACTLAIESPGKIFESGRTLFAVKNVHGTPFLAMRLPSGRFLWYCRPRIEPKMMQWGEPKDVPAFDGVNSLTRKWGTQYLYGGLLTENLTQATARDLLVNGMLNEEKHGYPIVMHVHDEAVAEVPVGFGSVEEFENLLCELPAWGEGLPLKAEGWRGGRYKK